MGRTELARLQEYALREVQLHLKLAAAPPFRPISAAASFFSGLAGMSSSSSPAATLIALPITSAVRRRPLGPVG